jgi:hypothetical protein
MDLHGGTHKYTTVSDAQGTRKPLDAVKAHPDCQLSKVFSTPWTTPNDSVDRWKLPTDPASKAKNRLTRASLPRRSRWRFRAGLGWGNLELYRMPGER